MINPQAPQSICGLDPAGQFHIGDRVMLACENGYIRVTCTQSSRTALVTGESLANLICGHYFPSHIIA